MQASPQTTEFLRRLWHHISRRRRWQFGLLLILMIFTSFAEVLSIGAVLPFLGALTAPERIFSHPAAQSLISSIGLTSADQLLLPLTVTFGLAALVAGAMRLLLLWASNSISYATGADLSIDVYRRTLYQPYAVHIARNSSEVISGISGKARTIIGGVLMPVLTLISSGILLIAILGALLAIEPSIALAAFISFGAIYGIIIRLMRHQLANNSERIARESDQVLKSLQEGFGAIRDILIDGSQATYCQIYRNADLPLRRAQSDNIFIGASPRYALEALGMVLIAGLAYTLAQAPDGIAKAIPVLAALALGAQRLLPTLQQGYNAWSVMISAQASLRDVLELLDQPLPEYADHPAPQPILYRQHISLNTLSFRYTTDTPWVLREINLVINRGARVGFIGATGSGKSTLVDIIMGLLQATEGCLAVDGQTITPGNHRSWQTHIAHVPQAIYLADTTIEENIAFGVPKDQVDTQRVRMVAKQAQIADIIETWPDGYQTVVGERGVRLSGGQRQRIGIARALYKQVDVIVFDEATSALDNETERAVMEAIDGLNRDLTILIIAHRLTTLQKCSQIVELGNGGILRTGTYQDLMGTPAPIH